MSNEEKEAIEILKLYFDNTTLNITKYVNIALNLIEKQSKEIEELKDKYSDEKIRNTVIKRFNEVIEKDYVSKDKIKAKIEKWDKDIKWNNADDHYYAIEVLQSLLEKE